MDKQVVILPVCSYTVTIAKKGATMKNKLIYPLILVALLASACGGPAQPDAAAVNTAIAQTQAAQPPAATQPPAPTQPPAATQPPEATATAVSKQARTLEDAQKAVIQIEATGTFIDPVYGMQANAAGRGSGFIISEDGLAVTNNHVVTGAALLKVWIYGEREPRNAKILGVSECSDLAVIDLEGGGYTYLGWYEQEVPVGLDVYTAGFPLGDPEFTMTKGIVSKARADGKSSWASVKAVIEHDAKINPGNSGGPLITKEGLVVGINYAGNDSTDQYFAIKAADARSVIDELAQNTDSESIGVNGTAVNDGSVSGIWVASVQSGSPADKAKVKAGDIITSIEGIALAQDGTMGDYCDILRSHLATDTLAIEVLRYDTSEVLAGKLNATPEEPLSTVFTMGSDDTGGSTGGTGSSGGGDTATYPEYTTITDDSGAISIEIPTEWSDLSTGPWGNDSGDFGVSIAAAANLQEWYDTWNVPGVFFGVTTDVTRWGTETDLLDGLRESFTECTFTERAPYTDGVFEGEYDGFENCAGATNTFFNLVVHPIDDPTSALVLVQINLIEDRDLDALKHIFDSFLIVGTLP